jgi:AcrR family transcriptional regulator
VTPRKYHSPHREAAAAVTRDDILDAALELFTEQGYARTSVADVAKGAGVTPATIYASIGSKPELVLKLMERNLVHPSVAEVFAAMQSTHDPAEVIEHLVAGVLRVQSDTYPLLALMKDAARVEPLVAAVTVEAEALSRQRFQEVVDRLQELRALAEGVSPQSAVDVLWFYLGVQSWEIRLTVNWESADTERRFLAGQIMHALIRPDADS